MDKEIEFGQNAQAFNEIARLVSLSNYGSFTLRLAILRPDRFVTGCLSFRDEKVKNSEQEILHYSEVTLASFTTDVTMWTDFASRLTAGNFEVDGIRARALLPYNNKREELYLSEQAAPPRRCYLFSESSHESLYSQKPLLGIDKPPYASLADASARYVHGLRVQHGQIQFERTLVIALPIKPRIQVAEWLPGEVRMRLFEDVPSHQADLFFWSGQGVIDTKSVRSPSKSVAFPVPVGTTMVVGHLLSANSETVQSFILQAPYSVVGERASSLSLTQQVRAEIVAGESDNREMKAFFNPAANSDMRHRVIHAAIAFANTSGGHIYIGVEDNGDLSGNSKLMSVWRNARSPEAAAQELAGQLRKVILENTRPVIEVNATAVLVDSDWVVMLEIPTSLQMVSNHTNDVFVRSGASNRRPSAEWLDARSVRSSGPPTFQ